MANFVIVDGLVGAPSPVTATDSVQKWPLGYIARGIDYNSATGNTGSTNCGAGMFVYCAGSNVSSSGQWCSIVNGTAVIATGARPGPVGVAAADGLTATSVYGWVQVQGKLDYGKGTNTAISTNQALYLGSIVGVAHSASVDGGFIAGAVCATSYATTNSNSAHYFLQFPAVLGSSAAM